MGQAIQRSRGHDVVISKDLCQVGEGLVAVGDDRLVLFVALADGLDEQAGMGLLPRQITDLTDDEGFGPGEVFDLACQKILGQTQPL